MQEKVYKMWSKDEIEFLKNNYMNMTNKDIASKLNRTKTAIDLKINKLGLKKSKYNYNHNFFDEINMEEKAYWLGFIFADGYIINGVKGNEYCNELGIELQASDNEHLRKFNKSLHGNIDIKYRTRQCNLNNKFYKTCFIRLYSKQIVESLIKHGITNNKSLKIEFPMLEDELIRHFVRGFFDGDGCIVKNNHVNGKSYVRCDFTSGSEIFINQLRNILYDKGIKSYIVKDKDNSYRLIIGGMVNCDNFLNYIYEDSNIYLDRKYIKKNLLYKELNLEQRLPL